MKVILAIPFATGLAACSALTADNRPAVVTEAKTPVEVWTGGDDGLTQRLADAIEAKLQTSSRFALTSAGTVPNALKIIIPTHVGWREVAGKTRVSYQLGLERDGRRISARGGECWETELELCAQQVVRTVVAKRM
jgi:hypothetical protein